MLKKLHIEKPKKALMALAAGHFINDSYSGFLAPLLPLLMERMDFSIAVAGMLASVFTFSGSFLQPVYGWLNDLLGKRGFVYLGPLVTAVFMCFVGYAPSIGMLMALLLLAGCGTAAYHPAGSAAVARVSEKRAGWSMSLFLTAGNFGHSLGPIVVVPVVMWAGFKWMPIMALPAVLIFLVLLKYAPPGHKRPVALRKPAFHEIFSRKSLTVGLHQFMAIARASAITAFGTFLPLLLKQRGVPLFYGSLSLTLFIAAGSAGALTGGYFSDRLDRKKMLIFSFVGALPFFLIFLHIQSVFGIAALVVGSFILYSTLPVNIVMAQELFPGREGTMAAMMIGLGWGTGGLLMTPLGFIAEAYTLHSALNSMMVFLSLAIAASLLLPGESFSQTTLEPAENAA